jgi:hypothetical protein
MNFVLILRYEIPMKHGLQKYGCSFIRLYTLVSLPCKFAPPQKKKTSSKIYMFIGNITWHITVKDKPDFT